MNDMHEQHAVTDFSAWNREQQAGRGIKSLVLQAQANVKPAPLTDEERLNWIAQHFSVLEFGQDPSPDKTAGFITQDAEGYDAMFAPKGRVAFKAIADSQDFRVVLDALIRQWS